MDKMFRLLQRAKVYAFLLIEFTVFIATLVAIYYITNFACLLVDRCYNFYY